MESKITLGGGCFWCLEAVYERYEGILSVVSGYAGGARPNPSYEQVCSGASGHAEVVEITYESDRISLETILEIFWQAHDPTTLNRQGNDVGTQYRSVIFYHDEAQRESAVSSMKEAQAKFTDPIVTEIKLAPEFYRAEEYHQGYFRLNPNAPYCFYVIQPKLAKLKLC